ncbi:adenylate kinase [Pilimelia anulata]|uniref:Adenylate kinase n=1 Tax=Pilimelia anulata TaxID=53371 RepID=A0A8J3FCE4_9ACTN|nr:AAA family ATPase [Pilimelia anulata]GGK08108.1 adenylate kinase [Pilimelia anulata]
MPLLGPAAPLPHRPGRILVAGTSGSGKTTTATLVAAALDLPRVELDALYHGPGWTPRPTFAADVDRFAAGPRWVTEWQYRAVRARLLARADLLVWLDPPRAVVLRQLIRRTLHRRLRRVELWNGNVEPPLWTILTDRDHVVRWAQRTHGRTRARVLAAAAERPGLCVVRLGGWVDVQRWVAGPLRTAADAGADGAVGCAGGDRGVC